MEGEQSILDGIFMLCREEIKDGDFKCFLNEDEKVRLHWGHIRETKIQLSPRKSYEGRNKPTKSM